MAKTLESWRDEMPDDFTPAQCYFRLHGRVRWRYQYEDSELEEHSVG